MTNIRLNIEYDGTDYHGWQRQLEKPTIQAWIEDSLAKVTGRRTVIYGASRTDSGVHARGQVANFYPEGPRIEPAQWKHVLNSMIPRSIRVLESSRMPYGFHSQRDALDKVYEYRVLNRDIASALDRRVYFHPMPIDWERVRGALQYFRGEHDFKAFQGAKAERRSTVRTITRFDLDEEAPGLYRFQVEGNGFLKQMVRSIVGTAVEIGEGKREAAEIPAILASRDRREAGRTLPASGLCLVSIRYPEFSWYGRAN